MHLILSFIVPVIEVGGRDENQLNLHEMLGHDAKSACRFVLNNIDKNIVSLSRFALIDNIIIYI